MTAHGVAQAAVEARDAPRPGRGAGAASVPRLALSPDEAAAALGCSRDFFDLHVAPELRIVRRGRRKFIATAELERWLDVTAARTLPDGR